MTPPAIEAVAVHVVDDDAAIRDSLDWLFRSRGLTVRLWESGEAFLAAWTPAMRGCVVLDVRMAGMSGLDVLDRLEELTSLLPVVVLTGHGDVPVAVQSLKKGAVDFLEKPVDGGELVNRVLAGLALEARRHVAASATRALEERLATLSPREREVMDLMLDGLLNKQIADDLGIAMRTVEVHRARILEKFGVRSAIELAGRLADLRRADR
ncbi:MAG: response regulator [Siculibacillus sp.]|nr:response regulator [Siculibacillus sp.]